jgi:hypothetical protein
MKKVVTDAENQTYRKFGETTTSIFVALSPKNANKRTSKTGSKVDAANILSHKREKKRRCNIENEVEPFLPKRRRHLAYSPTASDALVSPQSNDVVKEESTSSAPTTMSTETNENYTEEFSLDLNKDFEEQKEDYIKHTDLYEWLKEINLLQYYNNFEEQGFDSLAFVIKHGLSDNDLNAMQILKPGHKKRILLQLTAKQ